MHRRLGEYSKGMRQRAKLAQAMAHDPEVVFLDEPLTGCDPLARVRILEVIAELATQGRCVVVSSHVLHEIETMTSQILLIHKGQLLAEGDVYQIRELIDAHPHKVRVECDKPRALAREAGDAGARASASPSTASALRRRHAHARPAATRPSPRRRKSAGVYIRALTSPDDNLAAVFQYLTETCIVSERDGDGDGDGHDRPRRGVAHLRAHGLAAHAARARGVAGGGDVRAAARVRGRAGDRRPLGPRPVRRRVRALLPLPGAVRAGADRRRRRWPRRSRTRPSPSCSRGRRRAARWCIGKLWAATVPAHRGGRAVAWRSRGWWRSCASRRTWPTTWPHLLRVELAAVAGLCAFGALAAAIGTLFSRHPLVAVLVYLMLIEAGLGSAPIVLNLITVAWHLRNVAELPLPDDGVHGADGARGGARRSSPSP